jgi:RNA polymerase sigma factor (sigma-70 family)
MSVQASQLGNERLLVAKCLQGNIESLTELRDKCHNSLLGILLARGADRTEARDLLADLWADCVPGDDDHPSLLEKFSGKCTLHGWLATVVTNRWIDRKRKLARYVEVPHNGSSGAKSDPLAHLESSQMYPPEHTLVTLLRDSLKAAFARCNPEARVLLRLVYLHDLSQREIMGMLGWSESKVSRYLSSAMDQIEEHTLAEIKKRDPWLELNWGDFVDLCETYRIGFI